MYERAQSNLNAALATGALEPQSKPRFTYDSQVAPSWPEICEIGDSQSPIDIPTEAFRAELASEPLGVDYSAGEAFLAADEEQGLVIVGSSIGLLKVGGVSYNAT